MDIYGIFGDCGIAWRFKKMNKINKVISISLKISEWGKMKDTSMDLPWRPRVRKNRATLSDH